MTEQAIDTFEYKGRNIAVHKNTEGKYFFTYLEEGKEINLSVDEIEGFINSSFSHATINNVAVDMIERSVKFDGLLYNLRDLKQRIKKYKK